MMQIAVASKDYFVDKFCNFPSCNGDACGGFKTERSTTHFCKYHFSMALDVINSISDGGGAVLN